MPITIDVSAKDVVGYLRFLHKDQMPFAVSVALNQTANDMQSGIRQSIGQLGFTVRRQTFINNTIYRSPGTDFSTKQKFTAGVRIHPQRDVLAKFETDRSKSAKGGSVLVPIEARKNKGAVVPKGLWPKALGDKAFALKLRSGGKGLFRRTGSGLQLLYVFKPSVPLNHALQFEKTARAIATRMWPERMDDALARAIKTAR